MEKLFRFLHIVNLLFVAIIIVVHIVLSGAGLGLQFWLGFYQLSFAIIQLVSIRFLTSWTKTLLAVYWAIVGAWLILFIILSSVHVLVTVMLIIIPMLIACYSVYVSWHALKDITNYKS